MKEMKRLQIMINEVVEEVNEIIDCLPDVESILNATYEIAKEKANGLYVQIDEVESAVSIVGDEYFAYVIITNWCTCGETGVYEY